MIKLKISIKDIDDAKGPPMIIRISRIVEQ